MVGFTAAYESGALQKLDDELEDVGWFTADALPPVPPGYSIARALIDDFVRRNGVESGWGADVAAPLTRHRGARSRNRISDSATARAPSISSATPTDSSSRCARATSPGPKSTPGIPPALTRWRRSEP